MTADGSHTLFHPVLNESYHSTYGAIRESQHVFIEAGFRRIAFEVDRINILEVGFGTGLNTLLTQIEAETIGKTVEYTSIEAYPIGEEYWSQLNYPRILCSVDYTRIFENIHFAEWGQLREISRFFLLQKVHAKLEDYIPRPGYYDLVYFDAFSPDVQPELWTFEIFRKLCNSMKTGGILTTYSVKGDVTRALKAAGFRVEKIPGPPGKRQITRATKARLPMEED
jgi:tRNA U34 5-methylaminomethyl-2-thiouridine-forming methyltransferase MnmC